MKIYERLNLPPGMWDSRKHLRGIEIAQGQIEDQTGVDADRVWGKFNLADRYSLIALACYFSEEVTLERDYAGKCLVASEEFLFGTWRTTYKTREGKVDPLWWKKSFIWMDIFEDVLLWGSVLGRWELLKRVGIFPESDSRVCDKYTRQHRDLFVAIGKFLQDASREEVETLLVPVEAAAGRSCKLVASLMRAALSRDAQKLQTAFARWMKHYKKVEFPTEWISKKVSIEGTLFFHWAKKEGMPLSVDPEFEDHIVRLS